MIQSLSVLAASLLVGQGQVIESSGQKCNCQKNQSTGRVMAQPVGATETRSSTSWSNGWKSTSNENTWRGNSSTGGSWTENRPILSKIRGWFGRDDEPETVRQETIPQSGPIQAGNRFGTQGQVIIQNTPTGTGTTPAQFRRMPTSSEPPLAEPVGQPKRIEPATLRPAAQPIQVPATEQPLITIEPISFRPAGAKGVKNAALGAPTTEPVDVADVANAAVAPPLTVPAGVANTGAIHAKFVSKVGQPGDYSWITGQLEIRDGVYILHYATPDTVDRYNGKIVVYSEKDMRNLRHGDLVSAHGTVVQQPGRGPVYRATTVDMLER